MYYVEDPDLSLAHGNTFWKHLLLGSSCQPESQQKALPVQLLSCSQISVEGAIMPAI